MVASLGPVPVHPTRAALLDAALRLAEDQGLGPVSVNDIVAEAGVAKGTFYVHFVDRSALVIAIHQRFYDDLEATMAVAVAGMAPGPERLITGSLAYLDACLQAIAVKAVLIEARTDPAVAIEMARRTERLAALAEPDFDPHLFTSPATAARLYMALVSEAALIELERGGSQPAVRASLRDFTGASSD